jgi:hypothetical protein
MILHALEVGTDTTLALRGGVTVHLARRQEAPPDSHKALCKVAIAARRGEWEHAADLVDRHALPVKPDAIIRLRVLPPAVTPPRMQPPEVPLPSRVAPLRLPPQHPVGRMLCLALH